MTHSPTSELIEVPEGAWPWEVQITTLQFIHSLHFANEQAATLSYRRLRKAMKEWADLKNRPRAMIEVRSEDGLATFNVSHIHHVRAIHTNAYRDQTALLVPWVSALKSPPEGEVKG